MDFDAAALFALLREDATRSVLALTARVTLATLALHLVLGLALGYALARPGWPGRTLVDLGVTLPLVFPPMATGFLLLMLLGRNGPLGSRLHDWFGLDIVFTFWGLLLASFIAGLPLVVKPVQAAFEALSPRLAEAAATLGKTELQTFFFVLLPNVRAALAAGLILGLGRSLGEVGITLMLGGNIQGRTVTASLDIYNAVINSEFERAALLSIVLGGITAALFFALRRRSGGWLTR